MDFFSPCHYIITYLSRHPAFPAAGSSKKNNKNKDCNDTFMIRICSNFGFAYVSELIFCLFCTLSIDYYHVINYLYFFFILCCRFYCKKALKNFYLWLQFISKCLPKIRIETKCKTEPANMAAIFKNSFAKNSVTRNSFKGNVGLWQLLA